MAVGGARVSDPGADVALALAIASSATDQPLPADMVACGEIGLGGELRQVPQLGRRLEEAARIGFRTAIVPQSAPAAPEGMELRRAATVVEALALAQLGQSVVPASR
jgi:DNA repair protein RadA/Sms